MKRRALLSLSVAAVGAVVGLTAACLPGFAHHGTGINYDMSKTTAVTGTVTEFAWRNPHSQLYMDVKDDKGNIVHFAVELNSPGVLSRDGWTRHEFKPGDEVTINVHSSKSGAPNGECMAAGCAPIINGKPAPITSYEGN